MLKEIRSQLTAHGVPQKLLRTFEEAVRADAKVEMQCKVDAAERRAMAASEEATIWRLKHNTQQEKAQKFELRVAVVTEKMKRAQKSVLNISAYCKRLRHQIFGDKSERGASQPPATPVTPESTSASNRGKKPGTKGNGRKRDKGETQPVYHDLNPEDKVCGCGGEMECVDLSPETSYETHFEEKVLIREHIRRKAILSCKKCGCKKGIKTASPPAKLIPKGKYSTGFWRYVLGEKYWLQRPLNRVCVKFRAFGIIVHPGTLTNGLLFLYERRVFEVVYEAIVERSKLSEFRNMDETGWKVFAETEEKHSHRWHMWVSVTCDTTVFILDPRRSNEVVAQHLDGVAEGIIVCDRFSAYKCFVRKNQGFIIAYCWIHQRRDFIELKTGYPMHTDWADAWLARIDALIAQNKVRVAAQADPDEFRPQDIILRRMVSQMQNSYESELAGKSLSEEQRARLESLKTHWGGLMVFVDHPQIPMSNNDAERALREAVLGRKTYYGSRSIWSGIQTAWLFTIYETLEKNGVDPHRWMGEYLEACAKNNGYPLPDKELRHFLPWNYKPALPSDTQPNPPPLTVSLLSQETATIQS